MKPKKRKKKPAVCVWDEVYKGLGVHATDCGRRSYAREYKKYSFCHFCGKPLEVK